MTDEELTEEYAEVLCQTCTLDTCRHNILHTCAIKESIKQAFLAGLKAGKTKWHKVAHGDLPKENNLYLVAIKDNGLAIAYFNGLHWETKFNLGDFGHCLETVIAWCEIPEYTEE